jgi:hypothetical protein
MNRQASHTGHAGLMRSSSATVQQKVRESSKQAVWLIRARLGRRWIWVACGRATQVPRRRKGEPGLSLAASGRFCGGKPSFQTLPVMTPLHANETRRVCVSHSSAHSYSAWGSCAASGRLCAPSSLRPPIRRCNSQRSPSRSPRH